MRRVPIIFQMEALECGAACLCMISAYYGKWIPLSKVRRDCGVSRDGSVAKNILLAARNYGFTASGYKLEPEDISEINLPAIIHWNFNHFVVLTKINYKKKKAYLNDPARGRVVVSLNDFDRSFTGILLSIVPSDKFVPEGKKKSSLSFIKECLKNSLLPFFLASITSVIIGLLGLTNPLLDRIFLDNIINKNSTWLNYFIIISLSILFLNIIVKTIKEIHWIKIEGKFSIVSESKFMWHCLRLPLEFFSQRYIGDIISRQESASSISSVIIKKIAPMFIDLFCLIFYLFFMINYSWKLSLIGLITTFVNIFIIRYSSEKISEIQGASLPNSGKLMSITYSAIEMIETIKSTGAENGFFELWSGYYAKNNNSKNQMFNFLQYIGSIPYMIQSLSSLILKMYGILLIIRGNLTIGMFTAFQGFLSGFREPVDNFMDSYRSFTTIKNEFDRIEDVIDYRPDVLINGSNYEKLDSLSGSLELKDVTFGYNPLFPPLIENFSLKIEPGEWVAIVGESGCGKSTISKLVMGLYHQWSGQILFDGKEKSEIDPYVFHNCVSMVDQECVLFNDSINNNIKMWNKSIENFSVITACRGADIHSTIISRKGGYDYIVKERGKDFSGGQRQRLEIAHSLAVDPSLLILDEATSALDSKTEYKIIQNIRKSGCSCLVIAHRLSSIRYCDNIIVLKCGKICESGTHDNLMKAQGMYSKLVTTE